MSRKEEPVVLVEREGSASVLWFLIGGAIGAGLALLFAPHSGDQTRRRLGRRINKLRDAADQAITDLKGAIARESSAVSEEDGAADREDFREEDDEGGRGGGGGGEGGGAEKPERKRTVTAARRELEQRLADARARRHRALAPEDEEPVA